MFALQKGTLILADGVNNNFTYHVKEFGWKDKKGSIEVLPYVQNTIIEGIDGHTLNNLRRKTNNIFNHSDISTVDIISMPSVYYTEKCDDYLITSGNNVFAMLSSYFTDRVNDQPLRRYLIQRNEFFSKLIKKVNDPQNVGQSGREEVSFGLYLELLQIYKEIMKNGKVEKKEDYYNLLYYFYNLRQNGCRPSILENAQDFVKRYSK